jgi:hypothetical protein
MTRHWWRLGSSLTGQTVGVHGSSPPSAARLLTDLGRDTGVVRVAAPDGQVMLVHLRQGYRGLRLRGRHHPFPGIDRLTPASPFGIVGELNLPAWLRLPLSDA